MRVKIPGAVVGIVASAVMSTAVTACGSSDSKIAVDKVQKAADAAIATPTEPCPLGIDVNAALKKAGIAATATPDPGSLDSGAHAVDAVSSAQAADGSPFKTFGGGGMITCTYKLSPGSYVEATLTGVRNGKAVNLMAPMLQRDGRLARSDLEKFLSQKSDTGKALLTAGEGLAAVVNLKASGGDAALEVKSYTLSSSDPEAKPPIVGEPLRKLAEALGKQVKV